MSTLNELLKNFCANGVAFQPLADIATIKRGERITKKDLVDDGEFPVISGGIFPMGRYSQNNRNANTITISSYGAAGYVGFVTEKFWANDVCLSVFPNEAIIMNKFLYYALTAQQEYLYQNTTKAIPDHIPTKFLEELLIPVPPIAIQGEIVRILDNFTELTAELTEELEARKKQYNELAYQLLRKNNTANLIAIKELCTLSKGKTPIQKAEVGEYPMVVTTTERKSCNTYQYDDAAVCIPLVSSRGHGVASLNHVYYQEGKFALGNILCAAIPKDSKLLLAKYLYFYFECTKDYTLVPLMKGGANMAMHIPDIEKVKIPVPDITTQQRIVSKLEALDEYCNIVLPAEIKARQKQYEYYRDKLLTFKEFSV